MGVVSVHGARLSLLEEDADMSDMAKITCEDLNIHVTPGNAKSMPTVTVQKPDTAKFLEQNWSLSSTPSVMNTPTSAPTRARWWSNAMRALRPLRRRRRSLSPFLESMTNGGARRSHFHGS